MARRSLNIFSDHISVSDTLGGDRRDDLAVGIWGGKKKSVSAGWFAGCMRGVSFMAESDAGLGLAPSGVYDKSAYWFHWKVHADLCLTTILVSDVSMVCVER